MTCRDALEEDATRHGEPDPNPEEEGQSIPPPQIDGVKEAEAEKPEGQEADDRGLPPTE